MANKKKQIINKSSTSKLYKELSKTSRTKSKAEVALSKSLNHQLEKTLTLDLEVIFQRRMREDNFN